MSRRSIWIRIAIATPLLLLPLIGLGATLRMSGGTITLPSACVSDDTVSPTAAIAIGKTQHLFKPSTNFGLVVGGTPTTSEYLVFVASTPGTIHGFHCLESDTGTSSSIAYNLKKNGTSVLSSAVTITNSDTDGVVQDGSISTTTYVAGDRFTISETVSSSTGALGPFAWADLEESSPY